MIIIDYIISILVNQKELIINEMKNGNKNENNLNKIKQIDKAISWLNIVKKFDLDNSKWYDIFEFPEPINDYFSEYTIVDDMKNELEVNGKLICAGWGDLLITKKPK